MPGACRGSLDTAGGKLIPKVEMSVFVEGKPAIVKGDKVTGHGEPPHSSPVMVEGSPSVLIGGVPACRAGDKASCRHRATGSSTVNFG